MAYHESMWLDLRVKDGKLEEFKKAIKGELAKIDKDSMETSWQELFLTSLDIDEDYNLVYIDEPYGAWGSAEGKFAFAKFMAQFCDGYITWEGDDHEDTPDGFCLDNGDIFYAYEKREMVVGIYKIKSAKEWGVLGYDMGE